MRRIVLLEMCQTAQEQAAQAAPEWAFSGWVQAGAGWRALPDAGGRSAFRLFDDRARGARLQQAAVQMERPVAASKDWEWGGKALLVAGSDARYLHSRGLLDDQPDSPQWDPFELYGALAVAHGPQLKAGRFATPVGYETAAAPANALYSRSLLYNYAEPFTHTGLMLDQGAGAGWTLRYGLVRGWDVWNDNNGAPSQLAGALWSDGARAAALQAIVGPEQAGDESKRRALLDLVLAAPLGARLSAAFNADLGSEEGAAPGGGDALWYGAAGYLIVALAGDARRLVGRVEYFVDRDGARTGSAAALWEATLGAELELDASGAWRLLPELRCDLPSGDPIVDGAPFHDQLSIACGVLFLF